MEQHEEYPVMLGQFAKSAAGSITNPKADERATEHIKRALQTLKVQFRNRARNGSGEVFVMLGKHRAALYPSRWLDWRISQ